MAKTYFLFAEFNVMDEYRDNDIFLLISEEMNFSVYCHDDKNCSVIDALKAYRYKGEFSYDREMELINKKEYDLLSEALELRAERVSFTVIPQGKRVSWFSPDYGFELFGVISKITIQTKKPYGWQIEYEIISERTIKANRIHFINHGEHHLKIVGGSKK
jgi:hypothetical protein